MKKEKFTWRMLTDHDYRDEAEMLINQEKDDKEISEYVDKLFEEKYIVDDEEIIQQYWTNLVAEIEYMENGEKRPKEDHMYSYFIRGGVYREIDGRDRIDRIFYETCKASSEEEAMQIIAGRIVLEESSKGHYIKLNNLKVYCKM